MRAPSRTRHPPRVSAFTAQPTNATVGSAIAPTVQVTARDAQGNIVSSFVGTVTVALTSNPGTATLSGTLAVPAVAGVASFANLSLNRGEEGYTLGATSGTLTAATSTTFDVAEVVATYALRYYYDLNLETGTITNCQPGLNFCTASDDFYLAYNSNAVPPAVVFQNQQAAGARRIAHLAGRAFSGVHLADTTGAGFTAALMTPPFDNTRTILLRTDAGNIYKLGNPVGFGTAQADSVRFQAARLN